MSLLTVPLHAQHTLSADDAARAAVVRVVEHALADVDVAVEREIALGETRVGTLATGDPTLDDGEHYHTWVFNGRADDHIIVLLKSTAFDAYLAIFTEDGVWEKQDDDSGGDANARLDVTLPASGRYAIVVTSYAGGETGEYALSVKAYEPDVAVARGSTR